MNAFCNKKVSIRGEAARRSVSLKTIALSCIISDIKRDIDHKSHFFHTPLYVTPSEQNGCKYFSVFLTTEPTNPKWCT